jgi:hypothetical protein
LPTAGVWAKKIRGKLHYFGPWADPDGALRKYLEQKDALHAGRKPRADPEAVTVKEAANAFLNAKYALLATGGLSVHTRANYQRAAETLVAYMGKARLVSDLDPQDFASLRNKMAKKWGPHRLATPCRWPCYLPPRRGIIPFLTAGPSAVARVSSCPDLPGADRASFQRLPAWECRPAPR